MSLKESAAQLVEAEVTKNGAADIRDVLQHLAKSIRELEEPSQEKAPKKGKS